MILDRLVRNEVGRCAHSGTRALVTPFIATLVTTLGLLFCAVPPAGARSGDADAPAAGPGAVFDALEAAWNGQDAGALATLVQVDGLRVTLGGATERVTEYGPSQSLYYFQNLFRNRETLDFRFTRRQDVKDGERAHGMASWRFRVSNSAEEQELRLVFLLTRQDDVWRLSEINRITVR